MLEWSVENGNEVIQCMIHQPRFRYHESCIFRSKIAFRAVRNTHDIMTIHQDHINQPNWSAFGWIQRNEQNTWCVYLAKSTTASTVCNYVSRWFRFVCFSSSLSYNKVQLRWQITQQLGDEIIQRNELTMFSCILLCEVFSHLCWTLYFGMNTFALEQIMMHFGITRKAKVFIIAFTHRFR